MQRLILTACAAGAFAWGVSAAQTPAVPAQARPVPPPTVSPFRPDSPASPAVRPIDTAAVVAQYCAGCHSDAAKAGGLSLAGFDARGAAGRPDVTEKMIRKLRAGMMPPAGAKRPAAGVLVTVAADLEGRMDAHAAADPNPGWRPFQRLNRAEYASEVKRVLELDVDMTAFLPADTINQGFDNIADAQRFSATLMEGYLRAAHRITMLAVGDVESSASQATYKVSKMTSQLDRVEGAPLGTRGGVSVQHTFPADGDYTFSVDFYAEPLGLLFGSTAKGEQIEISVDGERAAIFDINPRMSEEKTGLSLKTPSVHVKAGPRQVSAVFLRRFEGLVNDLIAPIDHTLADTEIGIAFGITTLPHVRSLNIVGPHRVTGVSDTPSRRAIFSCRPTSAADERPCAESLLRRLSTDAFRRPVNEGDLDRLMDFYERGRTSGGFERGVAKALEAILASPQFLFRVEDVPATAAGRTYRVADLDLASRLSFFLWGMGPDPALLTLAAEGRLSAPGALDRQVTRMLRDPRARTFGTRFGAQWLRLQDLERVFPDPILYPYYDQTLADALRTETELFVDSIRQEDRSLLELLTADHTFVNERLARHYGLPDVTGSAFRRVTVPPGRRGLLGQGSILTMTSIADRTSPVQRGKWVLEVLLGSPPPPPPPNVPALEETKGAAGTRLLSVRERMEEHRSNPACRSCHRVIDPLGLALENFDVTGRWRVNDGAAPVDASGELYDGTVIDGPDGLRDALLRHKDAFVLSFTESLMTYALGRRMEAQDMPMVRRVMRQAAARDYRVSAFVRAVVASAAFQTSRLPAAETTDAGPAVREQSR